jgi:hypothetical protein
MMPLTEEKQKMLAKDIQYEMDEFRNSFEELENLKSAGRKDSAWNRALESTLLHFRNLRAFFCCEGNHPKSDVIVKHYIDSWIAEEYPVFDATKERIDKRLAHITVERPELRPDWPELVEMNAAIEKLISKFKESLSPAKASWFPSQGKPAFRGILGEADNSTVSTSTPAIGIIDLPGVPSVRRAP